MAYRAELVTYTVQRGDTLFSICSRFGVEMEQVVKLNRVADPSRIYPGDKISIPLTGCSKGAELVTYTVQRGDTLFSICSRFGVEMEQVVKLNRVADPSRIYPGDEIFIPVTGGPQSFDDDDEEYGPVYDMKSLQEAFDNHDDDEDDDDEDGPKKSLQAGDHRVHIVIDDRRRRGNYSNSSDDDDDTYNSGVGGKRGNITIGNLIIGGNGGNGGSGSGSGGGGGGGGGGINAVFKVGKKKKKKGPNGSSDTDFFDKLMKQLGKEVKNNNNLLV